MCNLCNYESLLAEAGLEPTVNRLRIIEIVGNNNYPLSASDIFKTMERIGNVNRVTVYRILDLLVKNGLVERISTGGRAFCYGIAPNEHHHPHPHFYCKQCGRMDCLTPGILDVDTRFLLKTFTGRIDKVEVRVDGICKECLKKLNPSRGFG